MENTSEDSQDLNCPFCFALTLTVRSACTLFQCSLLLSGGWMDPHSCNPYPSGGGGGVRIPKFEYKMAQINFPVVNFIFSHCPPPLPLRKHQESQESDGQTGSWWLDKAVLPRDVRYQMKACPENLPIPHP